MRVAQAGHQRRSHPVDDRLPRLRPRQGRGKAGDALRHLPDPVALDDDLAAVRIFARAVENADVGENDPARSADPVLRHSGSSLPSLFSREAAVFRLGRARPDVIRSEARAFLRLLERRPMAAERQNPELSAPDPVRKPLRGCRRRNRIVLAGDEKRRSPRSGEGPRLSRRRARRRIGRSRPGPAAGGFPGRRRSDRIGGLRRRRQPRRRDRVGDGDHAVPPHEAGAIAQTFSRSIRRLADRPEQREAQHGLGRARCDMLGDKRSHRVSDEMRWRSGDPAGRCRARPRRAPRS